MFSDEQQKTTASTNANPIDQQGRSTWSVVATGARRMGPTLITNGALFGVLYGFGYGWLYGLWALAYLTVFSVVIRVRAIAEHACTTDRMGVEESAFVNTRTTAANLLARATVAPLRVNYHVEHHLLMTVPCHKLPAMHRMLRERGALDESHVADGYLQVLRKASSSTT